MQKITMQIVFLNKYRDVIVHSTSMFWLVKESWNQSCHQIKKYTDMLQNNVKDRFVIRFSTCYSHKSTIFLFTMIVWVILSRRVIFFSRRVNFLVFHGQNVIFIYFTFLWLFIFFNNCFTLLFFLYLGCSSCFENIF